MTRSLPDGWQEIDEPGTPYTKFVKRDAVTVPKRANGEPFHRDCVVVITDDVAGVVKGPGARQSWQVSDPEVVGVRLAHELDAWVREGGDPYGGADLNERLEDARDTTRQETLS